MSVNKNFIIKNGLEVRNGLIFTDVAKANVGIGSTNLSVLYKFHVVGGIGATSLTVTGVTTTTSAVITTSAVVGSAVTINSSGVGANNLNVSGIVTSSSYYVGTTTVFNTVSGQLTLAGIQTIDSTTKASLERELALDPNNFNSLNVQGGISTLGSVKITSGIITAVSGVITYFGDGSGLTNTSPGPAGSVNNVQYNNGSVTAGSDNFVFTGTNVGIGTTNPGAKLDVAGDVRLSSPDAEIEFNTGGARLKGRSNALSIHTGSGLDSEASEQIRINNTGVGIGTTNPTSKLHVIGDGRFSGVVTATSFHGDGTNITNVGASLNAGSGTQNILLTSITSGVLTSVSIDTTQLQWNHNTNTLNTTNIDLTDNLFVTTGISSLSDTTATALNVSGISTFVGITTSTSTLFANQLSVAGVSTFAGITTVTGTTLFAKQLNVSGISTFVGIGTFESTLFANQVSVTGIVTAADFNSTSDANLKQDIQTFKSALDIVSELRGVRFNWKKDNKPSVGVIAQELEEILPELVSDSSPKTVNYNGIIGVLIEAVKELSEEVKSLKNQINNQ